MHKSQDLLELENLYDPTLFRMYGKIVLSRVETYLKDRSIRGLPWQKPNVLLESARDFLKDSDGPTEFSLVETDMHKFRKMLDLYIETGNQVHATGYMGNQFSAVVPFTGIFEAIGAIVNQPSSLYISGQLPSVAEKIMAEELGRYIGWQKNRFAMVVTHGGTLANMTAMLAARNDKYPDIWLHGYSSMPDRPKPAVAISEDAHYSLDKAVGILGIGKQQIVKLPTDSKRKIDMTQARIVLERAKEKGLDVFVIVATAGTTPVGAFDPIDELADLAHERGIWLHVDGAHGASLLLSEKLRGRLKGIEKADSITWDAHKTMFVPPLCTLLFYKDRAKSYNAFHLDPTYIFDKETSPYLEYDGAVRTFECTKRPAIMNLWFLWSLYGPSLFSALLERTHEQAIAFYRLLKSTNDFVALHQPECNIVSFKYTPPGIEEDQLSLFSEMIRERVLRRGSYCISKLKIDNAMVLRVVFSNPLITLEHCESLLSEIRVVGQSLLSEPTFAKQSLKTQKGRK